MNYYQSKQQSDLAAAKAQIAQAVAHYEYPSQKEIDTAWLKLQALKLEMAYSALEKVANSSSKKTSCGCTGKNASAGRRETKSVMKSAGDRPHFFANEMQRICREQLDQEYDAFCAKYL